MIDEEDSNQCWCGNYCENVCLPFWQHKTNLLEQLKNRNKEQYPSMWTPVILKESEMNFEASGYYKGTKVPVIHEYQNNHPNETAFCECGEARDFSGHCMWDQMFTIYQAREKLMDFQTKDSGQRQEFSTGMKRDVQTDKPRYDLIGSGWNLIKRWAELVARGAIKYGELNFEKAATEEELKRFKSSAMRHVVQWFQGETDEDHAAAVCFNIAGAEMVAQKLKNQKSA